LSDNIFSDAIKPNANRPVTHDVRTHPHFFQAAIEGDKLRAKARNMTRQEQFNNGLLTVEDMDDEELRCGRMRDSRGHIPRVSKTMESIPRDLYDAMVSEHAKRFDEKLRQQLDIALNTMIDVMIDPTAEPKDKMEAAKWFVDRGRGKAAERVDITVRKEPWEELLGDVAQITRAQHEALKQGAIDVESFEITETEAKDQATVAVIPGEPEPGDRNGPANDPDGLGAQADGTGQVPTRSNRDLAEPTTEVDDFFADYTTFEPPPVAPSFDNPASSNPVEEITRSQAIAKAQEEAARVAEARKVMSALRNKAKSSRKAARATGTDVLRKSLRDSGFDEVQNSFAAMVDDDANTSEDSGA
jgi:hypothetical protein